MNSNKIKNDFSASLVVFLIAIPLCLGIALASNAPLSSGLLAGIIGGVVVGFISGSHTSVSGPAAGLATVVISQINQLGSFESFLLALFLAGIIQIILGILKLGFIADFFPSSVIKGLLAAIGLSIILKQIPHLVGYDPEPMGAMSFEDIYKSNTLNSLIYMWDSFEFPIFLIGIISILILVQGSKIRFLVKLPTPLIVVLFSVGINFLFTKFIPSFSINSSHLVSVPELNKLSEFTNYFKFPDFNSLFNYKVYLSAITIALIASLETLLNLEAVDKIDPFQRKSPTNRELVAQGFGNMLLGLIGGIPVTSVIVRGSANIEAGAKTKNSTIFHGILILISIVLFSSILNLIPLTALAAILIVTGSKLANPKVFRQMWQEGLSQFIPFIITVIAILSTDLLTGILIGLLGSVGFILHSNHRFPLRRILEKHIGGDVMRIELSTQVTFLNRPVLEKTLNEIPKGVQVFIDATNTDYIDPDILDLIDDFCKKTAIAHGVKVSLAGFKKKYSNLEDSIQYIDYSTREIQSALTPDLVLEILKEGNNRFKSGKRLTRNYERQVDATAKGQYPLAVILSCIDSRAPLELIFDMGLGDIFAIRIAGNISDEKILGSMEFACAVAGAKLILVLGHTSCGAVKASVDMFKINKKIENETGCENLGHVIEEIQKSIDTKLANQIKDNNNYSDVVDQVAKENVHRVIKQIQNESSKLKELLDNKTIKIAGAIYDVNTGDVEFID